MLKMTNKQTIKSIKHHITQNYKTNALKNKKLIISYITLGLVFILMGNSNNNPSTYMERIFKPIYFKNGIFYYSTIISIMLVYYSLKNINYKL